jgi:hypothetical protein
MNWLDKLRQVLAPEDMRMFDLLGPPSLASGADGERYCRFVEAIVRSVSPDDLGDLIYLRDLIELEWDIMQYRSAKVTLISDQANKFWNVDPDSSTNDAATLSARAITNNVPKLRQLDLMIESSEIRRDRAYRELERRRAHLAKRLRDAVDRHSGAEIANDQHMHRAA